jgi:TolA-binding protein
MGANNSKIKKISKLKDEISNLNNQISILQKKKEEDSTKTEKDKEFYIKTSEVDNIISKLKSEISEKEKIFKELKDNR